MLKFLQIFLLQEAFGPIKLDRGLGYACPYCQKTMPHAAAMKQHIYTHTGEKPYKCNFCSYATNQPGTLNRHVNKLHKENCWDLVGNKKPPDFEQVWTRFCWYNLFFHVTYRWNRSNWAINSMLVHYVLRFSPEQMLLNDIYSCTLEKNPLFVLFVHMPLAKSLSLSSMLLEPIQTWFYKIKTPLKIIRYFTSIW